MKSRFTFASLLVAAMVMPGMIRSQTLVVVHKDEHTVGVYDATTGDALGVFPTGEGPHEVAVSLDGRFAAVTDYGAGVGGTTLTILDLGSGELAGTIELSYSRPHGAQFLADNRTVVVTAERDSRVILVDVQEGRQTGELDTRQRASHMVALSPRDSLAFTANISDGTLSIIPMDGRSPTVVRVGTQTEAIAASPDGRTVWLGSNNTGKVFVVDIATATVIDSVQTAGFPYRIAFTPDSKRAIVTNPDADEVRLIDAETREILAVIPTPGSRGSGQPFGLIVDPDGSRFWVTLRGANEVVEVSLDRLEETRRFSTGAGPDGIGMAQ